MSDVGEDYEKTKKAAMLDLNRKFCYNNEIRSEGLKDTENLLCVIRCLMAI